MDILVKKFEVSKELSEQISRRLLFALNNKGYKVSDFIEKKDLDGTLIRSLMSGIKLYEESDLQMIAEALELSQDFFLMDVDESDELKMTLYHRYYRLTTDNRKEIDDTMNEIFSILF